MLDALTYLLLNSTLLISVLALVFFLLGLWLGRLIWAGYRREAKRLNTVLRTTQTQLADAQEGLAACQQNVRAGEAAIADCQRALTEQAATPEPQPEPVPMDPDEVDDLVAQLRRQLDKTGSDLEIARAEAMRLADQLNDSKREAGRLRDDNRRLGAELQRLGAPTGASVLAAENLPPDRHAGGQGDLPPAWRAFESDLSAGRARIDDTLGLVFETRPDTADDLTRIKGIATVLNGKLNGFGIYTYRQIAGWDEEIMAELSKRLSFKDRVQRDDWVGQAKRLHGEKYGERLGNPT